MQEVEVLCLRHELDIALQNRAELVADLGVIKAEAAYAEQRNAAEGTAGTDARIEEAAAMARLAAESPSVTDSEKKKEAAALALGQGGGASGRGKRCGAGRLAKAVVQIAWPIVAASVWLRLNGGGAAGLGLGSKRIAREL